VPSGGTVPRVVTADQRRARLARREAALAARATTTPTSAAPGLLRVATWNVNSLRVRLPALERLIVRAEPDVVCLQETRTAAPSDAAVAALGGLGYRLVHRGAGAAAGVAVATRLPLLEEGTVPAAEVLAGEPRLVSCVVDAGRPVRVASVYVPHGREVGHPHYAYKLDFLGALAAQVRAWREDGHVVLAGDVNVAPTDSDVFHPDAFVGATHVSRPERDAWDAVLGAGLVDLDVALWGPRARRFTWWGYGHRYRTDLGMRIDVLAADPGLAARVVATWIDHQERGAERPSDHAALLADLDLRAG
jgi:exodeoxyribonuclease-3